MKQSNSWRRKVTKVFNPNPRIASTAEIWLERKSAARRLSDAFHRPHICLDGPTGAGKTSLALSHLTENQIPYVLVQVTAEMDWTSFCRQIIIPPSGDELSVGGEVELGIDKGLPTAKFRISLGDKTSDLKDIEAQIKMASSWTEHDVARRLAELNTVLFVDDFERANPPLFARLADLAKLLTESFVAEYAKLLFVGSGDIYHRLHAQNIALEDRLTQVSLGGFKYPNESITLLLKGFNKLRLRHPWNSQYPEQKSRVSQCKDAIWEAADGLPKSINSLGYEIAIKAEGRAGISWNDIVVPANSVTEKHWIEYAQRLPDLVNHLYDNPNSIKIVRWLYQDGIADIHKVSELTSKVRNSHTQLAIEDCHQAINQLVSLDFLVRTGKNGELVFVKHPTAAHTLGVAMRDPDAYKQVLDLQRGRPSLSSAFPVPSDTRDLESDLFSEF